MTQHTWSSLIGISRKVLILAVTVVATGCATTTPSLMAVPNLYKSGEYVLFEDTPEEHQSNIVQVLYATDREPVPLVEDVPLDYSHLRSTALACGVATVEFGEDILWEELAAASVDDTESKDRRRYAPRITSVDEHFEFPLSSQYVDAGLAGADTHAIALDLEAESNAKLNALIHERMAHANRREAYVFVHGYNVIFSEAVTVIGEIWHFLGRDGLPVAYTWPAGHGGIRGYTVDRESGEFTVFHLKRFLLALAASPDIDKIHIIAHSRGTDVLLTALRELHTYCMGAGTSTRETLKLGNLILAAADLDLQVVNQRVIPELVTEVPERLTVYISQEDRALGLASWLFASLTRLGDASYTFLDDDPQDRLEHKKLVDFVDARTKRMDLFGHSYFYQSPAVSSDLILVLRYDLDPGMENGRPLVHLGNSFWDLFDDYPDTSAAELVSDTPDAK